MPSTSPSRRLNLPLLALWVVSLATAGFGFWLQRAGTAGQAAFYTSGSQDPTELLTQQANTDLGALLVAAGVIGVLIALATHASNTFARMRTTDAAAVDATEHDHDLDEVESATTADHPDTTTATTATPDTTTHTTQAGSEPEPPRA